MSDEPKTERNMIEVLHDLDKSYALLAQEFAWFKNYFEKSDFVRRDEFMVLQRIVYGAVALILAGVAGAIINLVLK